MPPIAPARRLLTLLFVGAAAGPAAAQGGYDYQANCRSWPAVTGPHLVGTLEFELTDSLRAAQYAPTPTPARRLYVRAWYPVDRIGGARLRPYFTAAEAEVLPAMGLGTLRQPVDALKGCASLRTNGHLGAAPAVGRFPVVAFNHGYTSYPSQQTTLFEHLAANGYVALSIGHPYESGGLVYPNGDVVTLSPTIMEDLAKFVASSSLVSHFGIDLADRLAATTQYLRDLRKGSLGQLASVWQTDVYFVLDRLEELAVPEPARALAAAIDHDRRAYMGMSYGGYIAGMLAQGDARARAAVNLDGGHWTYELIDADLRTPLLMLNTDWTKAVSALAEQAKVQGVYTGPIGPHSPTSGDLAYEPLARAGTRDDIVRIVVPGIEHIAVSDMPELLGVPAARPLLGTPGMLKRFPGIQNDLVRGFLDRYLKGIANDFPKAVLAANPDLFLRDMSDIRRQAAELSH